MRRLRGVVISTLSVLLLFGMASAELVYKDLYMPWEIEFGVSKQTFVERAPQAIGVRFEISEYGRVRPIDESTMFGHPMFLWADFYDDQYLESVGVSFDDIETIRSEAANQGIALYEKAIDAYTKLYGPMTDARLYISSEGEPTYEDSCRYNLPMIDQDIDYELLKLAAAENHEIMMSIIWKNVRVSFAIEIAGYNRAKAKVYIIFYDHYYEQAEGLTRSANDYVPKSERTPQTPLESIFPSTLPNPRTNPGRG